MLINFSMMPNEKHTQTLRTRGFESNTWFPLTKSTLSVSDTASLLLPPVYPLEVRNSQSIFLWNAYPSLINQPYAFSSKILFTIAVRNSIVIALAIARELRSAYALSFAQLCDAPQATSDEDCDSN